jgi:hypothetical protein
VEFAIPAPCFDASIDYHLIIGADFTGAVAESDEANNNPSRSVQSFDPVGERRPCAIRGAGPRGAHDPATPFTGENPHQEQPRVVIVTTEQQEGPGTAKHSYEAVDKIDPAAIRPGAGELKAAAAPVAPPATTPDPARVPLPKGGGDAPGSGS